LNDPQSLNLYGYVGNNPLSKTDANGHHQDCGAQTSSTDSKGIVTVNANCREVPDELDIWAGYASPYNPHAQQMLAWHRYLTPQRMAVVEGYLGVSLFAIGGEAEEGAQVGATLTFRDILTADEQAEFQALQSKYPEWMPKDGLDAPTSVRTVEENAEARAQVSGRGHHSQPLKFGGDPNPSQGLVQTGETRTVKNATHTEITNFWNRVSRRIESQSGSK